MATNTINDTQRGLTENIRRPIVSANVEEIDQVILRKRWDILYYLQKIGKMQEKKLPIPESMNKELHRKVDNLYFLVMRRAKCTLEIQKYSRKAHLHQGLFGYMLDQASFIQSLSVPEEWRDAKVKNIKKIVIKMQMEALARGKTRLQKSTTSFRQRHVIIDKANLQKLGEDEQDEYASLLKDAEYNEAKTDLLKLMIGEEQEYINPYKRIQQNLGDEIFVREKARGTDDPGI